MSAIAEFLLHKTVGIRSHFGKGKLGRWNSGEDGNTVLFQFWNIFFSFYFSFCFIFIFKFQFHFRLSKTSELTQARAHALVLLAPLDVNNVHSPHRWAHEYFCLWTGTASGGTSPQTIRRRPIAAAGLHCWRQINVNIMIFSHITLIDYFHARSLPWSRFKSHDDPISDCRGDSAERFPLYTVWVKKSSRIKLFAVFSLLVNLCNWKLSRLLPKHIPMSTPILLHLSEYLCEMYHFYRCECDPSNFKNSI